jgi:hypothetical protein
MNLSHYIPLRAKNMFDVMDMYDRSNCLVAVNYIVYDKKRKTIIDSGTSRVNGCNHHSSSIHAEVLAIKICLNKYNKNTGRYDIIIWKFNKARMIKPAICCSSCTKYAKKMNFAHNIFTVSNNKIISAVVAEPKLSLGNVLRNVLRNNKNSN